jgi:hypothetical protein
MCRNFINLKLRISVRRQNHGAISNKSTKTREVSSVTLPWKSMFAQKYIAEKTAISSSAFSMKRPSLIRQYGKFSGFQLFSVLFSVFSFSSDYYFAYLINHYGGEN